jgi:hypothetical protein
VHPGLPRGKDWFSRLPGIDDSETTDSFVSRLGRSRSTYFLVVAGSPEDVSLRGRLEIDHLVWTDATTSVAVRGVPYAIFRNPGIEGW